MSRVSLSKPTITTTRPSSILTKSVMMDIVKEERPRQNYTNQSLHPNQYSQGSYPGSMVYGNNQRVLQDMESDEAEAYDIYGSNKSDIHVSRVGDVVKEGRVVEVNRGESKVTGTRTAVGRPSMMVGQRTIGSKIVAENYNERIISESYVNLPERVIDNRPETRVRKSVAVRQELIEEEPLIVEKYVDKEVEVLVERKVPKKVYVDVPYDVYVEQPIERIIEKEIEVEQVIEKEIERTIEVPVEKFVEIPIEEVVEKHVEVIRYVDVPVKRVVERVVEEHIENVVYQDRTVDCDVQDVRNYPNAHVLPTQVHENLVERIVPRPIFARNQKTNVITEQVQKIVRQPVERLVEQKIENIVEMPVFISNPVENIVTLPVERLVEIQVERLVEKPVFRKNLIKRPYPVEKRVEEIVHIHQNREVIQEVMVDKIKHSFFQNRIEKRVNTDKIVTVNKTNNVDVAVPVSEVFTRSYNLVDEVAQNVQNIETTNVEYVIHKERPYPEEDLIEIAIPKFNKQYHTTEFQRPVKCLKIIERAVPVETEVIVEVENTIERPVFEEVIEERPYIINEEVVEYYDVIREKIVEVPRYKDIEVVRKTRKQNPVMNYRVEEDQLCVDLNVVEPVQGREIHEGNVEILDDVLGLRIQENKRLIEALLSDNRELKGSFRHFESAVKKFDTAIYNNIQRQLADLKSERSEIESRLKIVLKDFDRLKDVNYNQRGGEEVLQLRKIAPEVHSLKRRLEALVSDNKALVSQAKQFR